MMHRDEDGHPLGWKRSLGLSALLVAIRVERTFGLLRSAVRTWIAFRRDPTAEPIGLGALVKLALMLRGMDTIAGSSTPDELGRYFLNRAEGNWPMAERFRPYDLLSMEFELYEPDDDDRRSMTVEILPRLIDLPTTRHTLHFPMAYTRAEVVLLAAPRHPNTDLGPLTTTLASVASKIAGQAYPWAYETWRADLVHGPHGREQPPSRARMFIYALGLVAFTGPRYRLARASTSSGPSRG